MRFDDGRTLAWIEVLSRQGTPEDPERPRGAEKSAPLGRIGRREKGEIAARASGPPSKQNRLTSPFGRMSWKPAMLTCGVLTAECSGTSKALPAALASLARRCLTSFASPEPTAGPAVGTQGAANERV
jgi:hypothetical protein